MTTKPQALDGDQLTAVARQVRASRLPPLPARRAIRQAAGVSLRMAAQALRVAPMTVARWEAGARPRARHAPVYARFLRLLDREIRRLR